MRVFVKNVLHVECSIPARSLNCLPINLLQSRALWTRAPDSRSSDLLLLSQKQRNLPTSFQEMTWNDIFIPFTFSFFPFFPFTFLRKHSNAWESWIDVFSNHKFKTPMSFCEDHFITNLSMGMQINICLNDFDYAWKCLRHLIYVVLQNGERMRKNHPRLRIGLGPGLNIYY